MVDQELESLIDRAGRDKVFDRARALGWNGNAPKWVWSQIAHEVLDGKPLVAAPTRRMQSWDEAVFGFRLF